MEQEILKILHELIERVHPDGGPKHLLLLEVEKLQQQVGEKHQSATKKDSKDGTSK